MWGSYNSLIGVRGLAFFKKDQELPGELKEKRNIAAVDLLAGDYDKAMRNLSSLSCGNLFL